MYASHAKAAGGYAGARTCGQSSTKQAGDCDDPLYLATLIEGISDAVISFSPDFKVRTWNRAAETMYGWTLDEVLGKQIDRMLDTHWLGPSREDISREIKTLGTWQGEMLQRRRNGERMRVSARASMVRDASGRDIGIVVVLRDVTGIRQLNEAFRRSEELYRALVENATEGIWQTDADGKIIFANRRAAQMFGVTVDELIGLGPASGLDDEQRALALLRWKKRKEGVRDRWEYRFTRRDGSTLWVSISSALLTDDTGAFAGVVAVGTDITHHKLLEDALRHERDRLTTMLDSMDDGVYIVNERHEIEYANPALRRRLTSPANHRCYEFIHGRTDVCPWCQNHNVFAGQTVRRETNQISTGTWLEITELPLFGAAAIKSKLVIVHDVTERRTMEKALHEKREELERRVKERTLELTRANRALRKEIRERKHAQRELKEFSGRLVTAQDEERRAIGRDLHDQTGGLITRLGLPLHKASSAHPNRRVQTIEETISILKELSEQVRNLSMSLRPPMLDDLGLLPALLWHVDRYTAQTGIAIDFKHSLPQELPRDVSVAAYRVVQETLTNVARHARADRAEVRVWTDRRGLHILVQDAGAGFDTQHSPPRSTGLRGLRERVDLLRGKLTVDSGPGRGTCVTADLPLRRTHASETRRNPTRSTSRLTVRPDRPQ